MASYTGWLMVVIGIFILVVIVRGKLPALITALR